MPVKGGRTPGPDLDRVVDDLRNASAHVQHEINDAIQRMRDALDAFAPKETLQGLTLIPDSAENTAAVRAFFETLQRLGVAKLTEAGARRAALLVSAESIWDDAVGPLFGTNEVGTLLGGVTRQRVNDLSKRRRLIALTDSSGRRRYPAFQFADGKPLGPLVDAFYVVAHPVSEWTAASWCTSPNDDLDDQTPARWAARRNDDERLARVAARDAARLAR